MRNKTPLYIWSGITLGAAAIVMLIMIVIIGNEPAVMKLFGVSEDVMAIHIFPWSSIIPAGVFLCMAIGLLVIVNMLDGKKLRIAAIVIAAVTLANRIACISMPYIENRLAAMKGTVYIAALSSVNSAISLATGVLSVIATVGFFFTCGMCVFFGNKD